MILTIQFGLYLLLMLGIGYYSMRRTKNNEDFIIGGRTLGPVTTAISAGGSDMSSWLLMGLPGAVFASGLVEGIWISLGLIIGAYANWSIIAPRLRAWGLGYFGQPHILARFIGIKGVREVAAARWIGMSWMTLCLVLAVEIGLLAIGYDAVAPLDGITSPGGNSERVFLALVSALFHPLVAGFILAAVLAAVMSTADSQLLVLTSALTEDLPFFSRFTSKQRAWISRIGVVAFALLAYYIASDSNDTILMIVAYAWGGFGAAFGSVMILSLIWRKTTKYGALAGMLSGAATIFIVKNYIAIEGEYLYELLPGFIIAFMTIIFVSALTDMPSEKTLEKFDAAKQQVKSAWSTTGRYTERIMLDSLMLRVLP